MRLLPSLLLILICSLLNVHCGSSSAGRGGNNNPPVANKKTSSGGGAPAGETLLVGNHFTLAPDIPLERQKFIEGDISLIKSINASLTASENAQMMKVMGISSLDGPTLQKWLSDRIRVILGEKISAYQLAMVFPREAAYGFFNTKDEDPETAKYTGASNTGIALYSFMKRISAAEKREAYARILVGDQWYDVTSPRAGIMQIGPRFFGTLINQQQPAAFANAAFRLALLFHEARHSDGNEEGQSLGFTHGLCTEAGGAPQEFVGKPACDASANGAYTVGAYMFRALYRNCGTKCSAREVEMLKVYYIDSLSRIMNERGPTPTLDDSPQKAFTPADISSFSRVPIE